VFEYFLRLVHNNKVNQYSELSVTLIPATPAEPLHGVRVDSKSPSLTLLLRYSIVHPVQPVFTLVIPERPLRNSVVVSVTSLTEPGSDDLSRVTLFGWHRTC